MSNFHQEALKNIKFVNDNVSWQSKLNNKLVMHGFIKRQMAKPTSTTSMKKLAVKIDQWVAKKVDDLDVKNINIDHIPCQLISSPKQSKQVLLYLHGGGFCIHLPKTYAGFVAQFCKALNINALIPDYRLTPEHQFPAAVDDCFHTYRWLLEQGYKAEDIIIAGDSAGGCLTLTTLLQIRDAKLPAPAAAVLISPASDCSREDLANTPQEIADADPMFTKSALDAMIAEYAPKEPDQTIPLLSPVFGEYHDLPPLQCHAGSTEIILHHSTRVIEKAKAAGVDASMNIWKEMPHVHPLITWLPESKQALSMMVEFFKTHLSNK